MWWWTAQRMMLSGRNQFLQLTHNGNLVSCSLSSSLVTLSALYFSPGLFFLIPLLIYSWGPCQIFISQPALWRLRSTVRFASWSLFLDLECELLVDLIDLFHGMYIWYCFLAWHMNFCLPFRCLDAANFSSVWGHLFWLQFVATRLWNLWIFPLRTLFSLVNSKLYRWLAFVFGMDGWATRLVKELLSIPYL